MIQPSSCAKACTIPATCSLASEQAAADFCDTFCLALAQSDVRSALQIFLDTVAQTPTWVHLAMRLRNRLVGLVGLKNLGTLDQLAASKCAADYQPGDRVGIFSLVRQTYDEAILTDNDKHLQVMISVQRLQVSDGVALNALPACALTTVVKVHNWLGRLYMWPVGPAHKIVAPAVLSRANRRA